MKRLLLTATVAVAVVAPPATAWQQTFRFATLGCYVTVGAPDAHVIVSVPPSYYTTGTTTFTTDCL